MAAADVASLAPPHQLRREGEKGLSPLSLVARLIHLRYPRRPFACEGINHCKWLIRSDETGGRRREGEDHSDEEEDEDDDEGVQKMEPLGEEGSLSFLVSLLLPVANAWGGAREGERCGRDLRDGPSAPTRANVRQPRPRPRPRPRRARARRASEPLICDR